MDDPLSRKLNRSRVQVAQARAAAVPHGLDGDAADGVPELVRRWSGTRVAAGLALLAAGLGLVAVAAYLGELGSSLALGAGLVLSQAAILAGSLLVLTAQQHVCGACGARPASVLLHYPEERFDGVSTVVSGAGPLELVDLAGEASHELHHRSAAAIVVERCSGCGKSGRLSVRRLRATTAGRPIVLEETFPVTRSAWVVEQMWTAAQERGSA